MTSSRKRSPLDCGREDFNGQNKKHCPLAPPTTLLSSLCVQTLRQVSAYLWADEIVRLTLVGCHHLAQKLSSAVHSFRHRPDPWFSHKHPKSLAPFANVHTLTCFQTKIPFFQPKLTLLRTTLPTTLTSLSLFVHGSVGFIHDMLTIDPHALPLVTSLNFRENDNLFDRPQAVHSKHHSRTIFITRNILARSNIQRFSASNAGALAGRIPTTINPASLPQGLTYLKLSFPVEFTATETLPTCLETLIFRSTTSGINHACRMLPQSLTCLEVYASGPNPYINLGLVPHLKALTIVCNEGRPTLQPGLLESLPPSITHLDVHPISQPQYIALSPSLRAALVNHKGVSTAEFETPTMTLLAKSVGSDGVIRWAPSTSLSEPSSMLDLSHLFVSIGQITVPQPLSLPPYLRELEITTRKDYVLNNHRPADAFVVDVPFWPTSLTSLSVMFDLPPLLSLFDLPNLTTLEFSTNAISPATSGRLPKWLRNLFIDFSSNTVESADVDDLLSSLPRLLHTFAFCADLHKHYEMRPECARRLPKGLVELRMTSTTISTKCIPFLPPSLVYIENNGDVPEWL